MHELKKIVPEEAGFEKEYNAYACHYRPLDFYRFGNAIYAVPSGADAESSYIQHGPAEYMCGWLYGAVQAACGQCWALEEKKCGHLVSVACLGDPALPEGSCNTTNFLYTGHARNSEEVKEELLSILRNTAEADDSLSERVYNWSDFFAAASDALADNGYLRLHEHCELTAQVQGVIAFSLACDVAII